MAKLSSMLWLTRKELRSSGVDLERDLAVVPKVQEGEEEPPPIQQWVEKGKLIGLPIDFGLRAWEGPIEEGFRNGRRIKVNRLPDPFHPKAAPGQDQFFKDVLHSLRTEYVTLAEAPTGSGKTVTVLNAIGTLKRSAVVVVPSNFLANQWKEEAKRHLGLKKRQIGIIGGGREKWRGKALVICVLHNLFQKKYPKAFYNQFGFAAYDEAHNLGARKFSETMHCFPAKYKIAVSATPDRKDGCAVIFTDQFGPVGVKSVQKALPITCHMVPFEHDAIPGHLRYCKYNTTALMWLSKHERRNSLLVEKALELYDKGYDFLIVSKYIDHVEYLIGEMVKGGIPADEIGQFTGKKTVQHTFKTGARAGQTVTRRSKVKQEELDRIKAESPVIGATYKMLKEGVDIPRLSAGMEAIPIADGRQAIGRARRPLPGKAPAVWLSIEDLGIGKNSGVEFLYGYTRARLKGYRSTGGVTIKRKAA